MSDKDVWTTRWLWCGRWSDANIWPAARDAKEIFWQIIIFQTFPVQGRRRHWGLWQSCDEALSHQNQNHSTYFPRNIISAESQLKFVSVRDSDLFAVQLWICSVWPKLYFPDIVSSVFVCAAVIRDLLPIFSWCCQMLWKPLICCRAAQLSHCLTWCGCVVATGRWCGFVSCDVMWISSRFLWRWLGGKNWEETMLDEPWAILAPCISCLVIMIVDFSEASQIASGMYHWIGGRETTKTGRFVQNDRLGCKTVDMCQSSEAQ